LAVALVCATFPLLFVGSLVTTYDAGMAVPDWPTTYGYNLFLYPWETWVLGPWDLFIEHGHRLLGALVGVLAIALAIVVVLADRRRWLWAAAAAAIVAVVAQGVIGGMRVLHNDVELARFHGCFAPLFFVLTVALAAFTSRWWREPARSAGEAARSLVPLALLVTVMAYVQLVLGARLRHLAPGDSPESVRSSAFAHVVLACILAAHIVLLAFRAKRSGVVLLALILAQLALGVGTWTAKYGWPTWLGDPQWIAGYTVTERGLAQAAITTGHVACGSLIFATAAYIAIRAARTQFLRRTGSGVAFLPVGGSMTRLGAGR
jgi:cytochrome c oxidase assembly protein subunit 15